MSLIAKGTHIVWSRQESTSTQLTKYAEILFVLETILGIASIPKHPLAHDTEFRTIQQELVRTHHQEKRKTEVRNRPV